MEWFTPSLGVSLVALTLSTLSFWYAWRKDREHNRRWDALNLARFAIKNLQFQSWRELPLADAQALDWGYRDVFMVSSVDVSGLIDSAKVRIPVGIVAYNETYGILETRPAITASELRDELARRKLPEADWRILKRIRIIFRAENIGSTSATDVAISAEVRDQSVQIAKIPPLEPQSSVAPGEFTWSFLEWSMPLASTFPEILVLHIGIKFRDTHGRRHEVTFAYIFDRTVGGFRRA